jgi:hypothetical protein
MPDAHASRSGKWREASSQWSMITDRHIWDIFELWIFEPYLGQLFFSIRLEPWLR